MSSTIHPLHPLTSPYSPVPPNPSPPTITLHSRAVFNNPLVQNAAERLVAGYLRAMDSPVTSHYRRSSAAFHDTPVLSPALMLYSRRDSVALVGDVERVAATWASRGGGGGGGPSGMAVARKLFDSPHVLHYQQNPEEYVRALNVFLFSVGLNDDYARDGVEGEGDVDVEAAGQPVNQIEVKQ